MSTVEHRVTQWLTADPRWRRQPGALIFTARIERRAAAIGLLDEVRACVGSDDRPVVTSELRGRQVRIHVRSPGVGGITDETMRVSGAIDTVVAVHLGATDRP